MQVEKLELYKLLLTTEEAAHIEAVLRRAGDLPGETLKDLLKIESPDGQEAFKILNAAILEKLVVKK